MIDSNDARREMFLLMLGNRNIALEACYASIDQAIAGRAEMPDLAMVYVERADRANCRMSCD